MPETLMLKQIEKSEFRARSRKLVGDAVHRHSPFSLGGISERTFSVAFSTLVYAQIWEDPLVDLEALALAPDQRMITIASGGCNLLSYLTWVPLDLVAVDLNSAHVALNRLKLASIRHLERYDDFYRLFGEAASPQNLEVIDRALLRHLDPISTSYWMGRDWRGHRRVEMFANGLYRQGVLGNFIGTCHRLARMFGVDPARITKARSLAEQRDIFETDLRPIFSSATLRKLLKQKFALFGLGIPPAQYAALKEGRDMHDVVLERLERLACGFDVNDNYFAWQAFNRAYRPGGDGPLPPYLQPGSFDALKANTANVTVLNANVCAVLLEQDDGSFDRYSLLDAQDWMTDAALNELWQQITRTARQNARVIFRTAGRQTILPGRVAPEILSAWRYEKSLSEELARRDRSAIYGGFHLYVKV